VGGLNVLIVNQYALPSGSAGITRHGDLGAELVRRGHEVTVIASRFNYLTHTPTGSRGETANAVRFRWLRTGAYAKNDRRRIRSMLAFTLRASALGSRLPTRPDVVIGSSPQLLAGLAALVIARRWRAPFIFEVRDPWPSALVDLGALRQGSPTHRLLEGIERMLYKQAVRIITVMEHANRRVAEVGSDPRKCVYVPNATQLSHEAAEAPPALAKQLLLQTSNGRLNVIYAGAHGISNGLNEVVQALTMLRSQDASVYHHLAVTFVGDGSEKPALIELARQQGHDNVFFHDAIAKPAMLAALQLADFVLVHFAAAAFKGYGMSANKLFDAMAAGRPVLLASPLTDTPVDEVRCGFRYEPGSPDRVAGALAAAVRVTASERAAMGERGRKEAQARYDVKITGEQLENLLLEVVASEGRRAQG
jgi:glycosyltransferase involved in cell wall biosynthesis